VSPAGEAVARLPAIVPRCWIWTAPTVAAASTSAGTISLASRSSDGEAGDDSSTAGGFSADGRYLAFSSWASNLVPGDTNGQLDAFVRDLGSCASCSG